MCIACEMGFLIAMDELPDGPPPGYPGYRAPAAALPDDSGFICDAPEETAPAAGPKPSVTGRE